MSNPASGNGYYPAHDQRMPLSPEDRMASDLRKYKKRSRILAVSTGILAVTTLIFGGIVVAAEVITVGQNHSALSKVYDSCKDADADSMALADHNSTLTVNETEGMDAYSCVASALPIPKATQAKIGATTGFSGTQTDSWDGYKATWSYSGDNGLTLVIQKD